MKPRVQLVAADRRWGFKKPYFTRIHWHLQYHLDHYLSEAMVEVLLVVRNAIKDEVFLYGKERYINDRY